MKEKDEIMKEKDEIIKKKDEFIKKKDEFIEELQKSQRMDLTSSEYYTDKHMITFKLTPSETKKKEDVKDIIADAKVSSHQIFMEVFKRFSEEPSQTAIDCARKMMNIKTEVIYMNKMQKREHESYYSSLAQNILKYFFPEQDFLHQHPLTENANNSTKNHDKTDVLLAIQNTPSPLIYFSIFEFGLVKTEVDDIFCKFAQLIVYCTKMVRYSQSPLPPILCCEYIMAKDGKCHGKLIGLHFFIVFVIERKAHHITVCKVEKKEELEMTLAKIIHSMVTTIPFYMKHLSQFKHWETCGENVAVGLSFDEKEGEPEKKVFKFYDYRKADENRFRRSPKGYPKKNFSGLRVIEICEDFCVLTYNFIEGSHRPQTVSQFLQIAEQLIALHKKKKVHGDVRLFNMLFTKFGAVLLDYDYTESETYPTRYQMKLEDTKRHPEIQPTVEGGFKKESKHDYYSFGKVCSFFKISSNSKGKDDSDSGSTRSVIDQKECQKMWESAQNFFSNNIAEKAYEILEKLSSAKLVASSPEIEQLIRNTTFKATGSPPRTPEKEQILNN